ncbi:obscurin-like protein isoform X2 [Wolffia australiana]
MQTQTVFLEDWLRRYSGAPAAAPPPRTGGASSARTTILQSWATLRDPSISPSDDRRLAALQTLADSHPTLHVADPQAKLLLSLLSSSPPPSLPFIFHLLSIWARKSTRPSPSLLQSALSSLSPLLVCSPDLPFPSNGVLLLGALSSSSAMPDDSRRRCLLLLRQLLREGLPLSAGLSDPLLPDVIAGVGYSAVASAPADLSDLTAALFGIWSSAAVPKPSLRHGLMILGLFEWLASGFIANGSVEKIESLPGGITSGEEVPSFAAAMAAAGILRAFRRSTKLPLTQKLQAAAEDSIAAAGQWALPKIGALAIAGQEEEEEEEARIVLQCMAVGLARCGPIRPRPVVVNCLCLAALHEVFPILSFLGRIAIAGELPLQEASAHVGGVLFKEGGAVSGILCRLYGAADPATQLAVEEKIWSYCHRFYCMLGSAVWRFKGGQLGGSLEEVAEAFFLLVVLFAAEATKKTLTLGSTAVNVLTSFSCVEYLRRIRLTEYTDAVRRAVLAVQEDSVACASFVDSMPGYAELTRPPVDFPEGTSYKWAEDEVQTARILFYLRVIPTCIGRIPGAMFGKILAPTIFLYLHHYQEKVAGSAHSVFAAFITSGMDSDENDPLSLKEKLVFYYVERSFEAYPGRTPFEGMASGVVALARHLPAGSPAMFYCIRSLVEKAAALCAKAMAEEDDLWKNWQDDAQPCRNLSDLLLRLINLVDIQLPREGQNLILGELHALVAGSDDVTRKPTLVSWVQSLSYLSSQANPALSLKNANETLTVHPRL